MRTSMPSSHLAEPVLLKSASVGASGLVVSDLRRSLDFYARVIGLDVLSQTQTSAQLGAAEDQRLILALEQRPDVHPLRASASAYTTRPFSCRHGPHWQALRSISPAAASARAAAITL